MYTVSKKGDVYCVHAIQQAWHTTLHRYVYFNPQTKMRSDVLGKPTETPALVLPMWEEEFDWVMKYYVPKAKEVSV